MQHFAVVKLLQQQSCCNVYEETVEPSRDVCSTLWDDIKVTRKKCWRGGIKVTVVNVETHQQTQQIQTTLLQLIHTELTVLFLQRKINESGQQEMKRQSGSWCVCVRVCVSG